MRTLALSASGSAGCTSDMMRAALITNEAGAVSIDAFTAAISSLRMGGGGGGAMYSPVRWLMPV